MEAWDLRRKRQSNILLSLFYWFRQIRLFFLLISVHHLLSLAPNSPLLRFTCSSSFLLSPRPAPVRPAPFILLHRAAESANFHRGQLRFFPTVPPPSRPSPSSACSPPPDLIRWMGSRSQLGCLSSSPRSRLQIQVGILFFSPLLRQLHPAPPRQPVPPSSPFNLRRLL